MDRPTYIPEKAWNIMSNANKQEFFKNQKVQHVINLDCDTEEFLEKKENYINFYKNKLFELENGYWQIQNNWKRKQLQLIDVNNNNIPNKIYKLYYEYPTDNLNNIDYYELFIDGREYNKFGSNILLNEWDTPREYIILIYIKNNKYPICYKYYFSDYIKNITKKNIGLNNDSNIELILLKTKNDIIDLNAQIFILQNM